MLKSIVDNLSLLPEHRDELKKKRGFTDDVIDLMQFKSCGPHVKETEWFSKVESNYQTILSQSNIAIPYFDPDKNVVYLRAHKYGPEGVPVHVYVPWEYMTDEIDTLVITEGEFKAVASCAMGVPSIGLPGVASFSKNNYNRLAQLLSKLAPKRVVICFDNEIKDDPKLPNYKPDFRKRYDTMFYAYVMANQLENISHIKTTIAVLPKDWMKAGKIDIDGVLADPKLTADDYKKVIEHAINSTAYKASWKLSRVHASYLERKLDKFFYTGPIVEQFNCFFAKKGHGEVAKLERISNFIIKVKYTLHDGSGKVQRLCRIYSKYGDSVPVMFQSDIMVTKQAFLKFIMDLGDYEFDGSEVHLKEIWKYIFMNQDGRVINLKHFHGYDEETGIWFFANGAYYNDEYYKYSEDNVVWVNDIGYRIDTDMEDIDPPSLVDNKENSVSIKDILTNLGYIIGEYNAKLLLGWTIGNFFMPEILKTWNIYPFIFLYGKAQTGKSTIANWVSSFFGFYQKGVNFHNSSVVGISRMASQMSMIPVWLEEYRNQDKDIGRKNNYLRGIYDRSTIVKGSKKETQIKTYKSRSTLILSGEEHPKDAALNSRCIMFSIFRDQVQQKTSIAYLWMEQYKSYFNYIGHYILTHKKELWPKVKDRISDYISSFDDQEITVSSRNKLQMSIVSGVIDVLMGNDDNFSYYVAIKAEEMERQVFADQALNIFLNDITMMYSNGRFKNKVFEFRYNKGNRIFVFGFHGAYAEWEVYYKGLRNDIPASKAALLDHLKREPYFLETKILRVGGKSTSSLILNASHKSFPQTLKMLDEECNSDPEETEEADGRTDEQGIE